MTTTSFRHLLSFLPSSLDKSDPLLDLTLIPDTSRTSPLSLQGFVTIRVDDILHSTPMSFHMGVWSLQVFSKVTMKEDRKLGQGYPSVETQS